MVFKGFLAVLIVFLIFSSGFVFAAINFNITTASVYKSSSTTIGSGTAICANVDIDTANTTCSGELDKGSTYRFEFVAENNGSTDATSPERSEFKNSFGNSQGVGTAALVSCGCNDDGSNVSGALSTNNDDFRCDFSGSFCTVERNSGSETFYFVITVGTDAATDTNPKFKVKDSGKSNTSKEMGLTVAVCGNNSKEGLLEVCDGTDLDGKTCATEGFDFGTLLCNSNCLSFDTSSCSGCGTACDGVCGGLTCFGTDPDCDSSGSASVACCGNNSCEGDSGESCSTCQADCGVCPSDITGTTACGDGICESPENSCNCNADCGVCEDQFSSETCKAFSCVTGTCILDFTANCCGNTVCEENEGYGTCIDDCSTPKDLILTPLWDEFYVRNEVVELTLDVKADSVPAVGASITASGFFGVLTLFDDGAHSDGAAGDGIFSNEFTVDANALQGENTITIDAGFLQTSVSKDLNFSILPKLDLNVLVDKEKIVAGQIIEYSGTVTKKGVPVQASAMIKIKNNENVFFEEEIQTDNAGNFFGSYHSTTADPLGKNVLEITALDEFENTGVFSKTLGFLEPRDESFLGIEFIEEIRGAFKRGGELRVTVEITGPQLEKVTGAMVELVSPLGERVQLQETGRGLYSVSYTIPWDLQDGKQRFELNANKQNEETVQNGVASFEVVIKKIEFLTELIEPKKTSAQVGDEIPIKVKLTYPNGEPVKNTVLNATINGQKVELNALEKGVYSSSYFVENTPKGKLEIKIESTDAYQNTSIKEVEVSIEGTSPAYFVKKFPVEFALILIIIIAGGSLFEISRIKKASIESLKKKETELLAKKKDLQTKYFKLKSIDRETYYKELEQIDPQLESVRQQVIKAEKEVR